MTDRKLVPLEYLPGYRMADDEPDVRGWNVVARGGAPVGRVVDILVDREAAEIAGLLLTVPPAHPGGEIGQATLPMERIRIDEERRVLIVEDDAVPDVGHAAAAPDRPVDSPAAAAANRTANAPAAPAPAPARAANPADRRAAEGESPADATGEDVGRVPVYEEQLVVTRRPVVKEMLVIRKRAVQDTRVVEADLRRERVDVERRDARPDAGDPRDPSEPPTA